MLSDSPASLSPSGGLPGGTGPLATEHSNGQGGEVKDLFEFLREAQLEHYYLSFTGKLKVNAVPQLKYVDEEDMLEIGMSRPEMRRLRKYFERECPQTAMGKLKKRLARSTSNRSASTSRLPGDLVLPSNGGGHSPGSSPLVECPPGPSRHLIVPDQLELGKVLGEGEFGQVHQGVWTTGSGSRVQVAVKVLAKEKLANEVSDFMSEVAVMHTLDHPNIVRLYGVVMEQDALKMVNELAPLRSLLECLKEAALRASFPVPVLHNFALQIAQGMDYLETKRLIHRDLAARNILVFSKDKVKISDFGMSRALQLGKEYYQTNFNVNLKLPIAWCAPECINYLRFTSSSDVWAFGVTLWEMFSYGFQPWVGLTGQQILDQIDEPVLARLEQPDCCPSEHYQLMVDCWRHQSKDRPTFAQIVNRLPRVSPEKFVAVVDTRSLVPSGSSTVESSPSTSQASTPINGEAALPGEKTDKSHVLKFKTGDVVVLLEKKSSELWKGVLLTGRTGHFHPTQVKPYETPSSQVRSPALTSRTKTRLSRRASMNDLGHRKSGRKNVRSRLNAGMISLPQNDLRHIGHVGFDGSIFGDVSFIEEGPEKLPVKVVQPYKPSNDILASAIPVNNASNMLSVGHSRPSTSRSSRHWPNRKSPSGSCLTITTVSELNSRLSTGTLTDVSSCMNEEFDDGEESPPYETLDQPSERTTPIGTSIRPPPLPPARDTNKRDSRADEDLFGDFGVNKMADSSSMDFASSLMDEVFKCFNMDDIESSLGKHPEEDARSTSTTATLGNNSRAESFRFSETDSPDDKTPTHEEPPPTPQPRPVSQSKTNDQASRPGVPHVSPTKRQEAIVKPMLITTPLIVGGKKKESSESSDTSSVASGGSAVKKKFSLKLGGKDKKEEDAKGKSLPIYAKPIKLVGGGNSKKQAKEAASDSRKAAISKPILITGPISNPLPSTLDVSPPPPASISPAASVISVLSSTSSTSTATQLQPAGGAIRALRRGEGVFRATPVSGQRRPSVGTIGTGDNTLTRSRQPSLPVSNRFTLPAGNTGITASTISRPTELSSTNQNAAQLAPSSRRSSSSSSASTDSQSTTSEASSSSESSDELNNTVREVSMGLSADAASFWGSDLAGLLGGESNGVAAQSKPAPPLDVKISSVRSPPEPPPQRKLATPEAEEDDIVHM